MARRTQIIEALVGHLGSNTDVHANNVFRTYKYMHDLNDFPAITFIPRQEQRDHFGDQQVHGIIAVQLRCYVYDGDTADIADECERLADQIEAAIDTFAETYRQYEVEEARVVSLRTDDGLMTPYGVADLQVSILYRLEDFY
jgi:inorganic pyrophosphatase